MEKLLTVKELAALLGVTPTCVYRWLGDSRLPAVRFSKRCVRFREKDVQELLEQFTDSTVIGHRFGRRALGAQQGCDSQDVTGPSSEGRPQSKT